MIKITGTLLNERYHLQKILENDGASVNYIARDEQTGRLCAVKILSLKAAGQWKHIELLKREAKVLKHLDHPGIPAYMDYFSFETADNVYYCLVQSYVEGKTLAQWVSEGRHFSEAEAIGIALEITAVLLYLHALSPP
ncbi:MAG: protein kinase, partial [Gammaproteobacteria bacterium]|nr:protein kinase [Gammaproteobacteria bacterium]